MSHAPPNQSPSATQTPPLPAHVLIVDPLDESREVLRTALDRPGLNVLLAGRKEDGIALARRHHPKVVVLDSEMDQTDADQFCEDFLASSEIDADRCIVLGRFRRSSSTGAAAQVLPKPYHYAALIRKIEQLLVAL